MYLVLMKLVSKIIIKSKNHDLKITVYSFILMSHAYDALHFIYEYIAMLYAAVSNI